MLPAATAEALALYRDALRAMRKRHVTIRLLDIGADKSLAYLQSLKWVAQARDKFAPTA